jgi:uncharacterized membrane protein YbhN (UPF0104 family)
MHMVESERPRPWRGRIPYRFLSLLVSAGLVAAGVALMYHRIGWRDVAAVWINLDPYLVAAAAVLYWLQFVMNSYRLQRVIAWSVERAVPHVVPLWFCFKLICGSAFVAIAAPVGLAGDAAKIAALRLFGSLSVTEAVRCALFDRVVGVQSLTLVGLAMLPMQILAGVDPTIVLAQLALFGGLIAAIGVLLVFPRALRLIPHDLAVRIARVFAGYRALLAPRRIILQAVIALVNIVCAWGSLYLLMRGAGLNASPWVVAGFIPLLQLVNGLPFLYMGWGGRELAMAATLGAASNLTINETLAVSIAWGVVLIMTGAVNGIFLLGDWQASGQSPPENGDGADERTRG